MFGNDNNENIASTYIAMTLKYMLNVMRQYNLDNIIRLYGGVRAFDASCRALDAIISCPDIL